MNFFEKFFHLKIVDFKILFNIFKKQCTIIIIIYIFHINYNI